MKLKISIFIFSIFVFNSFGQSEEAQKFEPGYNYQAELTGVTNEWHKIILPVEAFQDLENDLFDIRIFGITEQLDTIEAPYILVPKREETIDQLVVFKLINQVKNERGYFYTFEVKPINEINYIKLDFGNKNFNWKINLEGSQNQNEWFSIVEDYRLVGIKNDLTDYTFSDISFPATQYKYYRMQIKDSKTEPILNSSFLQLKKITEGIYHDFPIKKLTTTEDKKAKTTIVEINLEQEVPASNIEINVKNDFDYYRKITVQYLADSVKTEKGWIYTYQNLTTDILNSIEPNVLKFRSRILKKLRLIIENQDNQPLIINDILVKGYEYHLVARFSEPANYFLAYGNPNAKKPNYDLNYFNSKVPSSLAELKVGPKRKITKTPLPIQEPLFKNKFWLFGIMGFMILLLGWFSLKMIGGGE